MIKSLNFYWYKNNLSSYQKYLKSHGLQEFFKTGRIDMCPDIEEYAELLVHVASAQSRVEQETLQDVMKILSVIGEQIFIHQTSCRQSIFPATST
jgi:hypothetical protein